MKTITGNEIPDACRGLLYLCEYDTYKPELKVIGEIAYKSSSDALEGYSNIPNPASQLAIGNSKEEFEMELNRLHDKMNNPEWVRDLGEYL